MACSEPGLLPVLCQIKIEAFQAPDDAEFDALVTPKSPDHDRHRPRMATFVGARGCQNRAWNAPVPPSADTEACVQDGTLKWALEVHRSNARRLARLHDEGFGSAVRVRRAPAGWKLRLRSHDPGYLGGR